MFPSSSLALTACPRGPRTRSPHSRSMSGGGAAGPPPPPLAAVCSMPSPRRPSFSVVSFYFPGLFSSKERATYVLWAPLSDETLFLQRDDSFDSESSPFFCLLSTSPACALTGTPLIGTSPTSTLGMCLLQAPKHNIDVATLQRTVYLLASKAFVRHHPRRTM
jgi:hypothetical protein